MENNLLSPESTENQERKARESKEEESILYYAILDIGIKAEVSRIIGIMTLNSEKYLISKSLNDNIMLILKEGVEEREDEQYKDDDIKFLMFSKERFKEFKYTVDILTYEAEKELLRRVFSSNMYAIKTEAELDKLLEELPKE